MWPTDLATYTERVKYSLTSGTFVFSVSSAQGTFLSNFCLVCFPGFISWFPWPQRTSPVIFHWSLSQITPNHDSLKHHKCILLTNVSYNSGSQMAELSLTRLSSSLPSVYFKGHPNTLFSFLPPLPRFGCSC